MKSTTYSKAFTFGSNPVILSLYYDPEVPMNFVVPMLESERGWGSKVDGYAGPFETKEEAERFRDAYNQKHNNSPVVPDWYIVALDPIVNMGYTCDYEREVKLD